jgi:hypothetical protein
MDGTGFPDCPHILQALRNLGDGKRKPHLQNSMNEPVMVVHAYNLSTQEMQAGRL